jgi:WD40 repeat protein
MNKKYLLVLALLAISSMAFSQDFLLQNSHTAPVTAITIFEDKLITGSNDGTIRLWSAEGQLLRTIPCGPGTIELIRVHPEGSYLLTLKNFRDGNYMLESYDIQRGIRVFTKILNTKPEDVVYSPLGTYIAYTQPDWNSVKIIDARRGREQNLIKNGFGIVTKVFFSPTERTLLTYNPTGKIIAWSLVRDEEVVSISANDNIQSPVFSANGRYLLGIRSGRLIMIDTGSGELQSTLISQLDHFYLDSRTNNIVTISNGNILRRWNMTIGGFIETGASYELPSFNIYNGSYSSQLYLSGDNGQISQISFQGLPNHSVLAENNIQELDETIIHGDYLLAFTKDQILYLETEKMLEGSDIQINQIDNPFNALTYALPLDESRTLLYSTAQKGLKVLNADLSIEDIAIDTRFNKITYENGFLLGFSGNDTILQLDINNFRPKNTITVPSVQDAVMLNENEIIVSKRDSFPLVKITISTGETLVIENTYRIIHNLSLEDNFLYTLGISRSDSRTLLQRYALSNLNSSLILFASSAEEYDQILDVQDKTVFTSIGSGYFTRYSGGTRQIPNKGIEPVRAGFYDPGYLVLNNDSSISLLNTGNGNTLVNLILLSNGQWIAIYADKRVLHSENAQRFISTVQDWD